MTHNRKVLSLAVWLAACWAATAADKMPLKIGFVRGYDVETQLTLADFQSDVRQALPGEKVEFYLKDREGYSKEELLRIMAATDVFYINTHAGDSKTWKSQVIKAKPAASGEAADQYILPPEIRSAVGDYGGPKLVILNGCQTTAFHLENSQRMDQRLASGFGIGPNAKGRAYLGWQSNVVATLADKYLVNKLLKAWTTPGANQEYPTLGEAHQQAGRYSATNRLNIVGDEDLRYDFLRGYIRNLPIRGVWRLEPPKDKKELEDLGELGPVLLNLRFVVHGNGRLTAYYELNGQRKDAPEIAYWRLHGNYAAPQLTVIHATSDGKRKQAYTYSMDVNPRTPGRIGLQYQDTKAWVLRVGDGP